MYIIDSVELSLIYVLFSNVFGIKIIDGIK